MQCRFYILCESACERGPDIGWRRSGKQWICQACHDLSSTHQPIGLPPGLGEPAPGFRTHSTSGICAVRCKNCSLLQCFLHESSPSARGWRRSCKRFVCPSCTALPPHTTAFPVDTNQAQMLQCRYYLSCLSTATEATADGWVRWRFMGAKRWVCPHCQHACGSDLEVPLPSDVAEPQAGLRLDFDSFSVVCCAKCSCLRCYLHPGALKARGWRRRRGLHFCPACAHAPEARPAPLPFPQGCDSSAIATRVVALTEALNGCSDMPDWIRLCDMTDKRLRYAGRYAPHLGMGDPTEPDAGNAAGSVLLLAMLLPDEFGVPGATALHILGTPPPPGILKLSSIRARSSIGSDNRRTNLIEGLLNYWPKSEPCRKLLLATWVLMGRAVSLIDPCHRLRVKDMARQCFGVPDTVQDDAWWDRESKVRIQRAALFFTWENNQKALEGRKEEEEEEDNTADEEDDSTEEEEEDYVHAHQQAWLNVVQERWRNQYWF